MAELRVSIANAGDGTVGKVRVSMVPIGALGSPRQPFMDNEHDWYFCIKKHTHIYVCVWERVKAEFVRYKEIYRHNHNMLLGIKSVAYMVKEMNRWLSTAGN